MTAKRLSRRDMLKVSGLYAAGALLAACTSAQPTTQPEAKPEEATKAPEPAKATPAPVEVVNVQFMMWAWSPENEKFERDRVDMFNKSQADVVVEPIILPYDQLWTKLDIQVASGQAPDSVWYDYAAYPLIAKGEFIDLSSYVDLVPEFIDDAIYDQNFWTPAKMLGDEQMICLPIGGEGMNLFYNRDLFDAASEPYPTDELTWDGFLALAQRLTKVEGDKTVQFGTALGTMKAWWAWPMMLLGNGVDIVDSHTKPTKCTLDAPEAIAALQFLQDLTIKYKVAPDSAQTTVLADQGGEFGSGKVATYLDGAWDVVGFRGIDRFKWDIALLPKGTKGRFSPFWIGGPMIAKQSKHPDQTWEWARWTAEKDGQEIIARSGQQVTWSRKAREMAVDGAVPEHYSKRFETLQSIYPGDVWSAKWNEVLDKVWNPNFDQFWQGKITAEQLSATITPETTKLLQSE